jgi:hypothetical protein
MMVLKNYFDYLLHPAAVHEALAKQQTPSGNFNSLWESLSVSWIFFICQAIYGVIFLVVGQQYISSDWVIGDYEFNLGIDEFSFFKSNVLASVFAVVSFPLLVFYITKLWSYSIRFSAKIFERDDISRDRIEQVVVAPLSSHSLYLIPFVGGLLKNIWYITILYLGLRKNLLFSQTQAVFTLFLPVVILSFLTLLVSAIIYLQILALIQMIPGF